MHLHLPKPLHGWRAFWGEVGIIVLGVLIALGAQQVAEGVHERGEAGEAEATIRGELELNMAKLNDRSRLKACVDRRLTELQLLLDAADRNGGNFDTPNWVGRPQFWTMQLARWEASSQAGQAALIPAKKLALYGAMYAYMGNVNAVMAAEQADWARLRTLEHLHQLSPEMIFELTNTLQEAHYFNWRMNVWTTQLARQKQDLQLRDVANDIPGARSACVAMTTPRDQAIRESASTFGEP